MYFPLLAARLTAGLLFLSVLAGSAAGQNDQRIIAIVNDEVISAFDLEARLRLVLFSTRLADTPSVRDRIRQQVLDALINEKLQLQEATRLGITVSKQDLDRALATMERENNLPKGRLLLLLDQSNVPQEALRAQSRASLAWFRLIDRRLRPRVIVGDEEVDEILERISSRQGQTEYRLGEILLATQPANSEADALQTADRIVEQISRGALFSPIAKQFSHSPTAAVGGDLGWVHEDDLDPELKRILAGMKTGQVSKPVVTPDGIRIVLLRDARKIAQTRAATVRLDLHQLLLPATTAGNEADLVAKAEDIRHAAVSCKDFDALAKDVGSPVPSGLGVMDLASLSAPVQKAVGTLSEGEVSAPLKTSAGLLLLMVCSREEQRAEVVLPDRDSILDRLLRERLSRLAQRYLRDLRLSAVVDLRG